MSTTINLSGTTVATPVEQAKTEGRSDYEPAAEATSGRFEAASDEEDFPLDAEAMEAIRQGLADIDAGRTSSLEDSRARIESALAAHLQNRRASVTA